jgi:hypothetical protein
MEAFVGVFLQNQYNKVLKFFIVKNAPTFRNEALLFFGLITPTTALFV